MGKYKIPEELVRRFKDERVALFVGAGCSRSAGLPGWEDLLKNLHDMFLREHLIADKDKGQIKSWFRSCEDYPRLASYFKNHYSSTQQRMEQCIRQRRAR